MYDGSVQPFCVELGPLCGVSLDSTVQRKEKNKTRHSKQTVNILYIRIDLPEFSHLSLLALRVGKKRCSARDFVGFHMFSTSVVK